VAGAEVAGAEVAGAGVAGAGVAGTGTAGAGAGGGDGTDNFTMVVLIERSASLAFCSVTSAVNGSKPANSNRTLAGSCVIGTSAGVRRPVSTPLMKILAPSGVDVKRYRGGLPSLTRNAGDAIMNIAAATTTTIAATTVIAIQRPLP